MIKIENISKQFKKNMLFSDVKFNVESGKLVHIKGQNGSGKSTFFKIICDIMEPDSGKIILDKNVAIGAVIENSGFIENENVFYNLKYLYDLKNSFDEEKVRSLCERFNLNLYSKVKLKNYSVGMRQKVAIIQAVMEDQNLILFDEPTRGLDVDAIDQFFKLIVELKKQNKTIFIASHDLDKELLFDIYLSIEDKKIVRKEVA